VNKNTSFGMLAICMGIFFITERCGPGWFEFLAIFIGTTLLVFGFDRWHIGRHTKR
jgi:hypothetical protein